MKILVLGSEGFIGSNAVQYFSQKGYDVYGADIVLKEAPHYLVINAEQPDFGRLFRDITFDYCINATGAANVQFSFAQPAIDFTLNVSNVYHLLDAVRQYNPQCHFINFSSAAVYGNPATLPIKEDTVAKPLSPYGWHKLYSESVCAEFAGYFNIKTVSLRVFSAFGEGLRKQLFWDLFQKSKVPASAALEVYGSGNESRDFIYITDLLLAMECIMKNASFKGEVINIASGREIFIRDAVTAFVSFVNPGLKVVFNGQEKKGDPINWVADISVLKSLGFEPSYTLEQGLKKTVDWMQRTI